MGYVSKKFVNGEILTHEHMNNIITGIDELKSSSGGNGGSTVVADIDLYEQAKLLISRFSHQYFKNTDYKSDSKVDIAIFAGQSNSCGRATKDDVKTEKDFFVQTPLEYGFSFNNTSSTTPLEIVEPITTNGSNAYGYIPAFINSYFATTGRKICACYKSVGGVMLNTFSPYKLDSTTGQETTTVGTYYKNIVDAVNHAKQHLVSNGYEVGDVFLVWCQGEADAAYLGKESSYTNAYEVTLTTDEQKIAYYNERFVRLIEKLKEDVGLSTAFIIRIGQSGTSPGRNTVIVEAQNKLCKEVDNCVMVSTIFDGAKKFKEEDGTIRDLMRDASHYVPEGYLRAGMEAGTNAGIYNISNKLVKPILLEYSMLIRDDINEYERTIDKYIYDPCRIDLDFMSKFKTN